MISGFNTEFKCRGRIYHVQTEDNGLSNPVIVTLLYHQGAIMASRKTPYADQLSLPNRDEIVGKMMKEQHKKMMRDVAVGLIGLDTALGEQAPNGQAAEEETAAVEASVLELPLVPEEESSPAAQTPSAPPVPSGTAPVPSHGAVEPPSPAEPYAHKGLDQMILDYLARELEQGRGH
jgi:hypothetical protein